MQHGIEGLANALLRPDSLGDIAECANQTDLCILAIKHGGNIDFKNTFLTVNATGCETLAANALAMQRSHKSALRGNILSIGNLAPARLKLVREVVDER